MKKKGGLMKESEKILQEGNWTECIPLQGETLLVAKHKHWYIVLMPVIAGFFLTILGVGIASYLFINIIPSITLLLTTNLTILLIALTWISKIIIDWNYHLYIVTNHKILEIKYAPLSSHIINEVLLDQVRCAEVTVNTEGFIGELLDMGSISFQFDWAYHQQEVIFYNIKNARYVSSFLSSHLGNTTSKNMPIPTGYSNPSRSFPVTDAIKFPHSFDIFSPKTQIAA